MQRNDVALLDEKFSRRNGSDLLGKLLEWKFRDVELRSRNIDKGETDDIRSSRHRRWQRDRGEIIVLFLIEDFVGERNAGCHHFDHIAFDNSFCELRIFKLLAHCNAVSGFQKLWQICVEGMMRKSGQRNLAGCTIAASREGNAEDLCSSLCIFLKRLIEIPHAKEQYRVGILRLHLRVLLHQGS